MGQLISTALNVGKMFHYEEKRIRSPESSGLGYLFTTFTHIRAVNVLYFEQGCSGKIAFGGALVKYLGDDDGGTEGTERGAEARSAEGGGVWGGAP